MGQIRCADIGIGDSVMSYDETSSSLLESEVLNVIKNLISRYIILHLKNGINIEVTYGHYILVKGGKYVQ